MTNTTGLNNSLWMDRLKITAELVAAYVSNNNVPQGDLPSLLDTVHNTLSNLGQTTQDIAPKQERLTPVQIRKSITPDALISFIDGKPYKTLKRHLGTHGMDHTEYRIRYGLPADYPTVAANYAAKRAALARSIGLGHMGGRKGRRAAQGAVPTEPAAEPALPKPRGRRTQATA